MFRNNYLVLFRKGTGAKGPPRKVINALSYCLSNGSTTIEDKINIDGY